MIHVRVSEDEYYQVEGIAKSKGVGLSEYVRGALLVEPAKELPSPVSFETVPNYEQ